MRIAKLKIAAGLTAVAVGLAGGLAAVTGAPRADDPPKPTPAAKAAAEEKIADVLLKREKGMWESLRERREATDADLADDYVAVLADGRRLTRRQFLDALADYTLRSYALSDVRAVRLTADAAVLSYRVKTTFTYKGDAGTETVWVSSAWARRDGRWVNVLYQETTAE
jgi:hypothetical protein